LGCRIAISFSVSLPGGVPFARGFSNRSPCGLRRAGALPRVQREKPMALKIELKPFERIIIGESLITNSDSKTRFLIDGNAPILREKDIMTAETATTPIKRIYLCVQMMYLENDIPKYQEMYFEFVRDLIGAAPSFRPEVEVISNHILSGAFYKALKDLRKLIAREEELLR
jgi:flagellar biosynthesis repressor protein FlbT